ncbi:sporulation-specific protein 75 [[Candida] anglica]
MSVPHDVYNYTELTTSYMGFFYSEQFSKLFNTTHTGAAHSSAGMDYSVLGKTITTSLCFCLVQLTLFSFFRLMFKDLYQPRCYCVPVNERMDVLPRGFLSWIIPTLKYDAFNFLPLGLDAYLFVRFIHLLLLFFSVIGTLNIIILVPINWTGATSTHTSRGLDRLSLSNISPENTTRLHSHLVMALIAISLFHWLVIYELQSFVKIRQSHLLSMRHKLKISTSTILIRNVPEYLRDLDVINQVFSVVPGGIKNVWFLYDFTGISEDVNDAKEAMQHLEMTEVSHLKKLLQIRHNDQTIDILAEMKNYQNDEKFYPPIHFKSFHIPTLDRKVRIKLPGFLRIFLRQKKVLKRDWSIQTLTAKHKSIENWKQLLSQGNIPKHSKLFIQFQSQTGAYVAHQCLLSQVQGNLDFTLIGVNSNDVLWHNLSRDNTVGYIVERYAVTLLLIAIIILYIFPVSFIGLFSQLPLLVRVIPSLRWVYAFPGDIRETLASLLPSIVLTMLTELVLVVFRFLIYFRGKATGCEIELNLQTWYFVFLFVQQFLVVTISSSITVIFKQIIDQPTSIPVLLATNLPRAATFFFQYFALKAFAFCGNSFLRIDQLILRYTIHRLKDRTPRQIFFRKTTLLKVRWGSLYPTFSVFSTIGISYCIISPLINVFIVFILSLTLLYFKYALRFIFSHVNHSETHGRLYPIALLHMYAGIYCLEGCLIGIFFLSRDQNGNRSVSIDGWIMCLVLMVTIFGHITLYNRYVKHFSLLPILDDKKYENLTRREDGSFDFETLNRPPNHGPLIDKEYYSNLKLHLLHPAFSYEHPRIWIPQDEYGIASMLITQLEEEVGDLKGGSNKGAIIEQGGRFFGPKISIFEAPPDYK